MSSTSWSSPGWWASTRVVIDDRAAGLGPLLADALLGRALALLQGRAA
jgi:hypothetical protein